MAKRVHYQVKEEERYSLRDGTTRIRRVSLCGNPIASKQKGTTDPAKVTCFYCSERLRKGRG